MGKADKFIDRTILNLAPEEVPEIEHNRRIRGDRLWVSFPVFATFQGNLIQGYMEALNLSWSGMLIATNFPLSPGDDLELEFTLPGSEIPIQVGSRVIHRISENTPEEATQIGVAFQEMELNTQRMISGFVLQYLPHE